MEKSSKISYNEIAIIIPSYKEIANLKILVDKIEKILLLASNKDSVILDFMAGSGTTGHAVLEANKSDGGKTI